MYITRFSRSIALTLIITTAYSSAVANAGADKQSGKRRGPPPEAIEACADLAEGSACSFTGRRGEVTGLCIIPPRDEEKVVCAPEGGPPKDHEER